MNTELQFFILGSPAPGGSKNVFPMWRRDGSLVTRSTTTGKQMPILRVADAGGKANELWKAACAVQGKSFMKGARPFTGALKVSFTFYLSRPKFHYRSGKNSHMLTDSAPEHHITTPDALKFARSTEDALTGVIWDDDSQTVKLCAEKRFRTHDEKEGCAVRVIVLSSATGLGI